MTGIVSPGVYVTEKDLSLYAPELASSILGVVGSASKGPVNTMTLITDEGSLVRTFGIPSSSHLGLMAAVRYLRKGKQLQFVRVAHYDVAATLSIMGSAVSGGPYTNVAAIASAASTGTWGNNLKVKIEASTYYSGAYKISILDANVVVEVFDNCKIGVPADADYWATKINAESSYITIDDSSIDDTQLFLDTGTESLTGGDDGAPVLTSDIIGSAGSPPTVPATGLQIFRNPEAVDLNLLAVPGVSTASVVSEIIDICESRGDCFGLIDPPFGLSVQDVVEWVNGTLGGVDDPTGPLSSSYAAIFYPWLKVYDGYTDADVWVPPSGHIAGVCAFTDYTADPWFAPAGLNRAILSDVSEVEHSATQGERDFMYGGNPVNPIISLRSQGIVVWGQKTLQRTTSALDRINVRRLVLYIKKFVATAAAKMGFEPNDEASWRTFVRLVTPYMEMIKSRRGVIDYRVICDASTNPQATIDANEMHAVILLQPTKSAEKITVECTLLASGTQFEELA